MQGQPVCSYYSLYGICNYGPACRFDHPYGLSVPPTAFAYPPLAPYQRIASLVPVPDVSPAKSSRLSDWVNKETTAINKHHQNSNTKSLGESLDRSDSLPHSSKASSDVHHDKSDWRAVAWPAVTTLHHHLCGDLFLADLIFFSWTLLPFEREYILLWYFVLNTYSAFYSLCQYLLVFSLKLFFGERA